MRAWNRAGLLLIAAALLLGTPRESLAQLKGHYIPGFTGLQSGSQAPPSISVILPVYFYTTDSVKDNEGDTIAEPRLNMSFVGPGVAWVTNVKLLGGNLEGRPSPSPS